MADAGNGKRIGQYYPGLADACRRAYHLSIDAIRDAAREKGYAIAVHGSLARDVDLLAAPWREDAATVEELAEAVRVAGEQATGFCVGAADNPRARPHGRLCWSFHFIGGPYLDMSVMPRRS